MEAPNLLPERPVPQASIRRRCPRPLALALTAALFLTPVGCAPTPFTPGVTRNVTFAVVMDEHGQPQVLSLDVHSPPAGTNRGAAVVLFHGGGFTSGSRADMEAYATQLTARGFVAITADYRLREGAYFDAAALDQESITAILEATADGKTAVGWAKKNADRLGIGPGRVAAMGISAGATISIGLGMTGDLNPPENPDTRICTAISNAGSWTSFHATSDDAPTYFLHATNDTRVPMALAASTRDGLIAHGVPVSWNEYAGVGHVVPLTTTEWASIDGWLETWLVQGCGTNR